MVIDPNQPAPKTSRFSKRMSIVSTVVLVLAIIFVSATQHMTEHLNSLKTQWLVLRNQGDIVSKNNSVIDQSNNEQVRKQMIGTWCNEMSADKDDTIAFLREGTLILNNHGEKIIGTWLFFDKLADPAIRFVCLQDEVCIKETVGNKTYYFKVYMDNPDSLTLTNGFVDGIQSDYKRSN